MSYIFTALSVLADTCIFVRCQWWTLQGDVRCYCFQCWRWFSTSH